MRILTCLLIALSLLITPRAFAALASEEKDDISDDVRTLTREALLQLRGASPELDKVLERVESQLPNLQAYYSDEPLVAEMGAVKQTSIALNFPKYGLILFDRIRWPKIQSRAMKQAIALHEVLSLMGLETTGVYYISSVFLVMRGLTVEQMKATISGITEGALASSSDGLLTCDGALYHLFFRYEVWLYKFESCEYGGYQKHPQLNSDEADLITASQRVTRICGADARTNQKKISAASKVQTIIGTLKDRTQGKCGI